MTGYAHTWKVILFCFSSGHEFEEDFFDDYIEPEDYLPKKRLHQIKETKEVDSLKGEKEKKSSTEDCQTSEDSKSKNDNETPFLGEVEEMKLSSTVKSSVTEEQKESPRKMQ